MILPIDIAARMDLSVGLFCQGVIISTGPQVDPGFEGHVFCLLFNTSSKEVTLKYEEHFATIEFNKLVEPTYPYRGSRKGGRLIHYLPETVATGAINVLKQDLEQVRRGGQDIQTLMLTIFGLILAMLAIWVVISPPR